MKIDESLLEKVLKDPKVASTLEKLNEEERKKVGAIVQTFINSFVQPIERLVEEASNPETRVEIRRILERGVETTKENDESE